MIGDYKNKMSNVKSNTDIANGKSFQMPLYLLAAKKILNEYYNIDAEISGGVYYGFIPEIKDKKKTSHKFALLPQSNPLYTTLNAKTTTQIITMNENLEGILQDSSRV